MGSYRQGFRKKYRTLVSIVRARFFEIPIYYIAITPSILRWEVWPIAKQTNDLIEKFSSEDPLLHFIDTINFDYPIFIYLLTLFVLIFEIVKIEKSKNDKQ